jgi:hypothetical protein
MPGMNMVGTNTDSSTRVMAMIGPVTWPIAFSVASATVRSGSCSRMCSTASTTTMASSTTMPIASTSASSDTVLAEKPSASMTAKVPTRATGTAMIGMMVARRLPRNTKTTMATSTKASTRVWITLLIVACTNTVVSYITS